jgi:hypothetical protein
VDREDLVGALRPVSGLLGEEPHDERGERRREVGAALREGEPAHGAPPRAHRRRAAAQSRHPPPL